jgi:hypothetical protein
MEGNAEDRLRAELPEGTCVWCKEQIEDASEKELHVSLLGAPGEFHRACFEEYKLSSPG